MNALQRRATLAVVIAGASITGAICFEVGLTPLAVTIWVISFMLFVCAPLFTED